MHDGDLLVGVARSVTDFAYCCYLSDLAVCADYQRQGIGLELQRRTLAMLGPRCKLILLAAPAAAGYYPHIGFERHESCWVATGGALSIWSTSSVAAMLSVIAYDVSPSSTASSR